MHKVLLVDDDHFVRKGLLYLIDWEDCGFVVCAEANNGEDALEIIKEVKPDLIVTDIRMPVLNGLDLIKYTLEYTNINPNFIIISGYNDFEYAQQAMRYGVHDFILKPIDKEKVEKTLVKVSEKIKEGKMFKKNKENRIALIALEKILAGEVSKENDVEYQQKLKIEKAKEMRYVSVEINNTTYELIDLKDIVSNVIGLLIQDDTVLIREHGKNSLGLLVTDEQLKSFDGDMERFAIKFQDQIASRLNTEISLFIGETVNHLYEIKESFETAIMVSQFKYINQEKNPIYFENMKDESVNYIELDYSLYNLLMEKIEENDTELILNTIDEMFQVFKEKMFARDAVRTSINRCVHELIKTIKNFDGNESDLSSLQIMLHWDSYPFTQVKIKELFTEFVLEGAELLLELTTINAKGSIHKVKKYIEKHFQENITLKSIAQEFYMNPVYLGQLFKKTYGIYFKDFVLQVRIIEAKKILRQTDMRVYGVAESVGFGNADYFVTQFEKIVGMTPTQYRKKIFRKST